MKQINVYFDDEEHEKLDNLKKELKLSWHDLIIRLIQGSEEQNE